MSGLQSRLAMLSKGFYEQVECQHAMGFVAV